MQIIVRVNGVLVQKVGAARLSLVVADGATVADLLRVLVEQHPQVAAEVARAVVVVAGVHVEKTAVLSPNQEVALLLPVAGGEL
ncbi:MAG: MoaD/ThiS family protein [Anaerolineales bacterium]|nr:MoaD/ThiS family protein [Anaerolineales bacterium]